MRRSGTASNNHSYQARECIIGFWCARTLPATSAALTVVAGPGFEAVHPGKRAAELGLPARKGGGRQPGTVGAVGGRRLALRSMRPCRGNTWTCNMLQRCCWKVAEAGGA